MALSYTNMTELQAVNLMLSYAGYEEVSELNDPVEAEAARARAILHRVSRDTQSTGYSFNTFYRVLITVDGSSHIVLPTNTLNAVPTDENLYQASVKLDTGSGEIRLYDLYNNTDEWTTISDLRLTIVKFLTFAELPTEVASFILWRAMEEYLTTDNAPEMSISKANREAQNAFVALKRYEVSSRPNNVLNHPINSQIYRRGRIYNR